MDITDKYAITIWGVLSYIRILRRFKHIGPWHINTIFLLAFLIGLNVYLTFFNGFFNLVSVKETSARAANLSLINVVPVIAGPSQSFLASPFGLSLRSFRKIHRSLALLSLLLVLVHVAAAMLPKGLSLFLNESAKSVEEAKAVQEVAGKGNAVIINLKDIVQERLNREFHEKRLDKQIRLNHDIIQIVLELSRPVRVTEGQYIGLWIPAVGKFSFLQVHPFMVTSWSEGDSRQLRLLVEPRHGWTKKLLQYTRIHSNQARCRALFTGPYGVRVPTRNYGIVLLVASSLGIVGQIPYLKQLIHDYNVCRTRTRRIHLLTVVDLAFVFEEILNEVLIEDTLDDGRILSILIYIESGIADQVPFGRRAVVYSGPPNLEAIFQSERAGGNIKRVQKEEEKREDMLILGKIVVPSSNRQWTVDVRDNLHKIAQSSVRDKVSLVELEYQPDPPM
ncbi:ferric reductase [Rhypophila sp. PSN 637]